MQHHDERSHLQNMLNLLLQWLYRNVHKITYKQYSIEKGTNTVKSAFVPFWCVPKLPFGNVI